MPKARKPAAILTKADAIAAVLSVTPDTPDADADAIQRAAVAHGVTETDTAAAVAAVAAVIAAPETAPETAAAPSPSELRAIAASLFRTFNDNSISIPIKPLATFKAYRAAIGYLKPGMQASRRQAAALCVAALASGHRFNTAEKSAPVTFPRAFPFNGQSFVIENGCNADCVSAGLASYCPKTETYTVTAEQARAIAAQLGKLAAPAFA